MIRDRSKSEPVGDGSRLVPRDRSYWSRVLIKYWSSLLLTTAVVVAAAVMVTQLQTPTYTAQATVAVYPASGTSSAVQPFVMGTEKGIASSEAVLSVASSSLLIPVSKLQHGLSITVPADTDLLVISYSDPDPQVAQSVAEGVAHAYVAYRTTSSSQPAGSRNGSTTPSTAAAVQVTLVTNAALPSSPVSPNRWLILGVAAILGLGLGLGQALLRDWMDDSLRGPDDLVIQADAPVLGQIPAMRRAGNGVGGGLAVVSSPNSGAADAYLSLRTQVLHAAASSRHAGTLLVTCPGEEDKGTIAANLAAAVAMSGRKVVLVCADPRWGRAEALFGLKGAVGVTSIVQGDAKLAGALRPTEVPHLRVLPSGPVYMGASSMSQSTAFQRLLAKLRKEANFVVIDAPPVLASAETGALAGLGAMVLLVADDRATTRTRVQAASNELAHVRDDVIGWVLNHERGARRFAGASGDSSHMAAVTQAAAISPPPPARLTWDDISGAASPADQNVAQGPAAEQKPAARAAAMSPPERARLTWQDISGETPRSDENVAPMTAAEQEPTVPVPAMSPPEPARLTWDDIRGETPRSDENVAPVTAAEQEPAVLVPAMSPPGPARLIWDDISGETRRSDENVAPVTNGHRIRQSGSRKKTKSNGSYEA